MNLNLFKVQEKEKKHKTFMKIPRNRFGKPIKRRIKIFIYLFIHMRKSSKEPLTEKL